MLLSSLILIWFALVSLYTIAWCQAARDRMPGRTRYGPGENREPHENSPFGARRQTKNLNRRQPQNGSATDSPPLVGNSVMAIGGKSADENLLAIRHGSRSSEASSCAFEAARYDTCP